MANVTINDLGAGTPALTDEVESQVAGAGASQKYALSAALSVAASTLNPSTVTLAGNLTAAAWTTSGIGLKETARTLTDSTSTGTVAAAYSHVIGANTIAASSATTFTDYATLYLADPIAGGSVTLTNKYSLVTAGQAKIGGNISCNSVGPISGNDFVLRSSNTGAAWKVLTTGMFVAHTDNSYDVGAATGNRPRSIYAVTSVNLAGSNGQNFGLKQLTELTTVAAAATTTTTIQLPAGAIILAVSVRVTTVIPDAATFTVGDAGSATRFSTAAVSTAATSTDKGTAAGAYYNAAATGVVLTFNTAPLTDTGRCRVTIVYFENTAPTS